MLIANGKVPRGEDKFEPAPPQMILEAAKAAAPYMHARKPVEMSAPEGLKFSLIIGERPETKTIEHEDSPEPLLSSLEDLPDNSEVDKG